MLNKDQFHEQLPMFVSAREIKEQYHPLDYMEHRTKDEFWQDKLEESKVKAEWSKQSTYRSVGREGVKRPVQIYIDPATGQKNLGQGHHRVISQYEQGPDELIPATFTNDEGEAIDEDDTDFLKYLDRPSVRKDYVLGMGAITRAKRFRER